MRSTAIVFATILTVWQPAPTAETLVTLLTTAADWDVRLTAARELLAMLKVQQQLVESDEIALPIAAMILQESAAFRSRIESQASTPAPAAREQLYNYEVVPIVEAFLNRAAPLPTSFVEAAASLPHHSSSPYTRLIARQGLHAAQVGVAMTSQASSIDRMNGISLLAEALRASDLGSAKLLLTPLQRAALVQTLRLSLQDTAVVCRREAVRGVGLIRDVEALPLLMQVALTDPDNGGRASVRQLAAEAVKQLQQ